MRVGGGSTKSAKTRAPIVPFLPQRVRMNISATSFVQQVVPAAQKVVFKPAVVGHPIQTVAELRQQIHDDLRRQHPEWIEPGGESSMCDFYESRLSQLLETCARSIPAGPPFDLQRLTCHGHRDTDSTGRVPFASPESIPEPLPPR